MDHETTLGNKKYKIQRYAKKECISFAKVDGPFGALHNMAPGCPIVMNEVIIKTSEHLYQAMRFPHRPDIQQEILDQKSPMTAKMKMKEYIEHSRTDWDEVKVAIMGWCLSLKLIQNWDTFGYALHATGTKILVEYSKKDGFWGAVPQGNDLVGINALGNLLMKIRERLPHAIGKQVPVKPPAVADLLLLGKEIAQMESQVLQPFLQKTTVVNRYHNAPYDEYIGRGTKWGNPFSHMEGTTAKFKVETREEAIERYREWLMEPEQKHLMDHIPELKGKALGCSCKPLGCHGDVLVEFAEQCGWVHNPGTNVI